MERTHNELGVALACIGMFILMIGWTVLRAMGESDSPAHGVVGGIGLSVAMMGIALELVLNHGRRRG